MVARLSLQNRVDPYGRLCAVSERGAWMGNRGVLHDDSGRVVAAWRLKRWITCALQFGGRQRQVFAPRRYSELFFLDEATSFAAGHRPCAECRHRRYREFRTAWIATHGLEPEAPLRADAIDAVLHAERLRGDGGKRTYRARIAGLPAGTLIEHRGHVHLIWNGVLWPWSFSGYGRPASLPAAVDVDVLTPESIVRIFRSGLRPQVHATADG